MNVGCMKDTSNKRCGAVLTVMAGQDCSMLDSVQCTAQSQCRWNTKTSSCKDQFTESFLKPLCDGGFITTMAATIGMNKDAFAKEAKLMDSLFCSKDGDKMCMPLIQNEINQIDEMGLTAHVVSSACENHQKLRCMKRVYGALAQDSVGLAELDFYYCVETILDDGSIPQHQKVARIEYNCIENVLAATLSAVDQTNEMLNNMCSKNTNGSYCMSFPHKYENSTCLANMLFNNQCPYSCKTEIDNALTDIGCCSGNLQQVHGFVPFANLPQGDIPEFETFEDYGEDMGAPTHAGIGAQPQGPGYLGAGSGSGTGTGMVPMPSGMTLGGGEDMIPQPKWYFFANYQGCSAYSGAHEVGKLVWRRCKKVRAATSNSRTLNLGLSYDTIAATDKKKNRFMKKLKYDLTIKLGMSQDDFPSFDIGQDSSRTINLAPAGAPPRRRATSTTSASATTFDIQTENTDDTTASTSAYDTAVAAGTLTLTSTIALVKNECSNCTSTGTDYTSVNTVATAATVTNAVAGSSASGSSATASPTSSSTSSTTTAAAGGAAMTSVLAAVLATLIAVLAL